MARDSKIKEKTTTERPSLSPLAAAAVAIGGVTAAALIGGRSSPSPDHPRTRRWYRRLDKPSFTPPDAVFGVAWPLIQTGLAIGAYRLLRKPGSPARDTALGFWTANQAAIAGWSALFFGERAPGLGTLASAAMIGTGAGYVASAAAADDKPAAAAGVPLVAWLGFATILAEEVWRRNRDRADV